MGPEDSEEEPQGPGAFATLLAWAADTADDRADDHADNEEERTQ